MSFLLRLSRTVSGNVDRFVIFLLLTVAVATLLPARGSVLTGAGHASTAAVCLLFFLHGAKLSPRDILDGARQWRLHGLVFATTFVVFPVLGLACRGLVPGVLTHQLWIGVVFLAALPSTVQSSIAFTAIARGNVAAALCSASVSNLLGVVLTPVLLALLIGSSAGISGHSVLSICAELLAPFALGQLARPRLRAVLQRHASATGIVDRGSVLLVVYVAFSAGVDQGVWHRLPAGRLVVLALVCCLLLALVLGITWWAGGRLGFPRADKIVAMFCGSKKSLVSGLPMATVLFPRATVAIVIVPLIVFHMIQLITCAVLARRLATAAERADTEAATALAGLAETPTP
ncbi:bile acid:sodium symporter family protein [Dactylosporangium sp. NPDC048998]|uniref:bile acid:sodium symporter family protein n=1 Tax=Dactylosporangium sp. NPDC048998 TaxID=3363976 RepID=UPI0037219CDF